MADVAARAGVSLQTVSRVVNGHHAVRADTRERVELAIADLGYRVNTAARALVTRSTRTVGVVGVSTAEFGPTSALHGLEAAARAAGYATSVVLLPDVDRAILRMAVFELLWVDDVPDAVVIDEAVELAKMLSTDDSASYVNGVLAGVLKAQIPTV